MGHDRLLPGHLTQRDGDRVTKIAAFALCAAAGAIADALFGWAGLIPLVPMAFGVWLWEREGPEEIPLMRFPLIIAEDARLKRESDGAYRPPWEHGETYGGGRRPGVPPPPAPPPPDYGEAGWPNEGLKP
jgi:hypothetical protein